MPGLSMRRRFRDGVLFCTAVAMVAYATFLDHRPMSQDGAKAVVGLGDGRFDVRRVAEADLRPKAP